MPSKTYFRVPGLQKTAGDNGGSSMSSFWSWGVNITVYIPASRGTLLQLRFVNTAALLASNRGGWERADL